MTDAQVAEERFLVVVNDMLTSGEIPDLFSDDDVEMIINGTRNEVPKLAVPCLILNLCYFSFIR